MQLETENKGWNNHEETFEEALRRELLEKRDLVFLYKEDLIQLTKAYYKLAKGKDLEFFTDRLRQELTTDEGCKYETYLCSENKLTGGIGHLILGTDEEYDKPIGSSISKERVTEWFEQDIATTIKDCKRVYEDWDNMHEEVRLICANMMFQLGRPRYSGFKLKIQAVKNGDWLEAANQMQLSRWYGQTKNRADRLISRMKNVPSLLRVEMARDSE